MSKRAVWYFCALIAVAIVALVMTQWATYQASAAQDNLIVLLWIDIALLAIILLTLIITARRMWRDYRQDKRGARLSLRLTLLLLALSLTPVALLYAAAANSVFRSIESWFDTPLDRAFEQGIGFGQDVIGVEFAQLERAAREIAQNLGRQQGALPFWIDDLSRFHRLQGIYVYDHDGAQILSGGEPSDNAFLSAQALAQLAQAGKIYNLIRPEHNQFINLEVVLAMNGIRDVGSVAAVRQLPANITDSLREVEAGRAAYENLKVLRIGLRWSFLLTLSLSLGLILLAVCWVCIALGRRLATPLVRISAAATAVGGGDLSQRLRADNKIREIDQINRSFNAMVSELDERQRATRQATAYLQNLLEAVPVGIITFSPRGEITLRNTESQRLFNYHFDLGADIDALSREPKLDAFVAAARAHMTQEDSAHSESRVQGARGLVLLLRVITLSTRAGGGWLVVCGDITKQIQAARGAAWEEATRRAAHEIKNPLMPIQLACERMRRKLVGKLAADDAEILQRMTRSIINQVDAMREIINEFRDYANERQIVSAPIDINALIGEVTSPYEGADIRLDLRLDESLPAVAGDSARLRQMLLNLLVNARDAVARRADARIAIITAADGDGVLLQICDNGGGISDDILHTVCEPYMTTKAGGSGLGLAVVQKIVEEHRGGLSLENADDGLRARVRLPVWQIAEN